MNKEVGKKKVYNSQNAKVNNLVNEMNFVLNLLLFIQVNTTQINKLRQKIYFFENKIPEISGLVSTAALNTKVGKVENKISNTSELATTTVLKTKNDEVDNKIPDVNGLLKDIVYE